MLLPLSPFAITNSSLLYQKLAVALKVVLGNFDSSRFSQHERIPCLGVFNFNVSVLMHVCFSFFKIVRYDDDGKQNKQNIGECFFNATIFR